MKYNIYTHIYIYIYIYIYKLVMKSLFGKLIIESLPTEKKI